MDEVTSSLTMSCPAPCKAAPERGLEMQEVQRKLSVIKVLGKTKLGSLLGIGWLQEHRRAQFHLHGICSHRSAALQLSSIHSIWDVF